MSTQQQQGFVIFQDGSENSLNPVLRKTKREEMQVGKAPATKRAALGTITNQTRVQPFRAAKVRFQLQFTFILGVDCSNA